VSGERRTVAVGRFRQLLAQAAHKANDTAVPERLSP
jgi:hypothetical protein